MPTRGGLAGANSATSRVRVLNRRAEEPDVTAPQDTAVAGWAATYGGPVAMKLAVVVRADLEMGRGKIAAQVAHAAVAATLASFGGAVVHSWLESLQADAGLQGPAWGQPTHGISPARFVSPA